MIRLAVGTLLFFIFAVPSSGQQRQPWKTSQIKGSPEAQRPYVLQRLFPDLHFTQPVDLVYEPTTDRYYMVELGCRIVSFPNDPDAGSVDLALDLRHDNPSAHRSLSIVFHPRFSENRYAYVCYLNAKSAPDGTRISRFTVTRTDPPRLDPDSEERLLTWPSGGHNGCKLLFGPDGMLYFSAGDAAPPSPPDIHRTGQDISDLPGSVLRIDVDHRDASQAYAIPKDNPFVTHEGARPEVWAYGFRNPWRMSFDRATGDLWVGDVGWELWELVFRVQRGGNYGWSIVEGSQTVHPSGTRGPTPIQPPAAQHPHTESMSITGGYVYRGSRLKGLQGKYIYGDYITGRMWALSNETYETAKPVEIANTSVQIITFCETPDHDLLVVDYDGGIHQLAPNPDVNRSTKFPRRLSETGLFEFTDQHAFAPGVIEYEGTAQMWTDHALGRRGLGIPNLGTISNFTKHNAYKGWLRGKWEYPPETVFAKTYSMDMIAGDPSSRRRLETQLLHLDGDTWRGYSYVWNDDGTDAELAPASGLELRFDVEDPDSPGGVREHTWHVASRAECMMCHNPKSGIILGFRPELLHDTGGESQLVRLNEMGLFRAPALPKRSMANPSDKDAAIDDRARTWLHLNCSHCHQRGGGGTTAIDLRFDVSLDKTDLLSTLPTQGRFGIADARLVAPGDPYRSILFYRVATTGVGHMPHLGAKMLDVAGSRLIHDWIVQLSGDADPIDRVALDHEQVVKQLESTPAALRLLHQLHTNQLTGEVRARAISAGANHASMQISGMFQRFVPASERRKTLGRDIDPASILSLDGDSHRGAQIIAQGGATTCLSCHRIAEKGRELGPSLIGLHKKYKRAEVLNHILDPSQKIEERHATWLVITIAGESFTGFITKRNESQVTLQLTTGTTETIAADEIDLMERSKVSAMPEHLLQALTAQEAADLLDYLMSLKE